MLEIPGTLLVERWSARKWICRIMVSWGIVAALTAFVHYRVPGITHLAELTVGGTASFFESVARSNHGWLSQQSESIVAWLKEPGRPFVLQFFSVRFLLGLAEAGFFPGVIVYLTHWFPARDRARALSWFFIATPVAQFVSPKLSYFLLRIGTTETVGNVTVQYPALLGHAGLAVDVHRLGHPGGDPGFSGPIHTARLAQGCALARARRARRPGSRVKQRRSAQASPHESWLALRHPKVLLLAAAYFFVVSTSYGVEFFLPSILEKWYALNLSDLTWAVIIPPLGGLAGQLLVGWNSDRTGERRLHGSVPIYMGAVALWRCAADPRLVLVQPAAGPGRRAVHRGACRAEGVHAGVLGAAQPDLDRVGRRGEHRPDQFAGQPGGIRRPRLCSAMSRPDPFVRARADVSLLLDGRLGHDHPHPGPGPPHRQPQGRGGRRYGNTRLGRGRARRDHRAGVTRATLIPGSSGFTCKPPRRAASA